MSDVSNEPRTIDIDPRSVIPITLSVIILGVVIRLGHSMHRTLIAVVIGTLIALALNPIVIRVQNKMKVQRAVAIGIVVTGFVTLVLLVAVLVLPNAIHQARGLPRQVPATLDQLGDLPIVGSKIKENDIQNKIKKWVNELPDRLALNSSPLEKVAQAAVDGVWSALLTLIMALLVLIDGERLAKGLRRFVKPSQRPTADRVGRLIYNVIGRYFAGSIFVAAIAAIAILAAGLILGIPLAPLAALWILVTNMIPQIGGFLGAVPFVTLGFAKSPLTGVLCLIVFLIYQQIENHIIGPLVIGRTVSLSPPITMAAALIGVSAGGVIGALLAVPICGAIKAVYLEFHPEIRAPEKPHHPQWITRAFHRLRHSVMSS